MDILTVFCQVDDFCQVFEPKLNEQMLADGKRKRIKSSKLSRSEVMTILIAFHRSGFRNLKTFYKSLIGVYYKHDFPDLVSYNRFVELQRDALVLLGAFMQVRLGKCSGISFIDSTKIAVCNNLRIKQNKVFKEIAKRGKTSTGWFYGFKIHLIISDSGELLAWQITLGNVDDRKPVEKMSKRLWGKLFGDKGYISQELSKLLGEQNVQLVTKVRKNMKNKVMPLFDRLMLRKRAIIESVNDQLKNISQVEHTRHRSVWNFYGNIVAGLIAYTFQEKKPRLELGKDLVLA
ncbi:MAG TPA: IS982 family transposase [Pyrinomonadaceae bacterium]|nr:IS982 family transposase [Pyrinomonadaceae bacterium]